MNSSFTSGGDSAAAATVRETSSEKMASELKFVVLLCLSTGLWLGAEASCEELKACKTCPAGWSPYGKSCYMFHHSQRAWADAEKFCTTEGGNLVSLHSKEERLFIQKTLQQVAGKLVNVWVGGYDAGKEGVWLWTDGSLFDFKDWNNGEPNNFQGHENCMEMNYAGRDNVNDNSCWKKKSFICAKSL